MINLLETLEEELTGTIIYITRWVALMPPTTYIQLAGAGSICCNGGFLSPVKQKNYVTVYMYIVA